jgi:WD40 repeat protein
VYKKEFVWWMPAKQKQYTLVKTFTHQASRTAAMDFHSQMLALCTKDGVISIIDVEEGEIVRTHHCYKYGVNAMRFFHTSETGAVSSAVDGDTAWRLWDFHANKFSAVFRGHDRLVKSLEIHPVDDVIASTCSQETIFWDVRNDKIISRHKFRCPPVFEKAQGRFFIAAPSDGSKTVALFDIRNFDKPFTNFRFDDNVNEIALSPDGATLAASADDRVVTMDVQRGTSLARSPKLRSPRYLSHNWSGEFLSVCTDDRDVQLYKAPTLQRMQSISDHDGPTISMFSPTRDLLVSASTGVGLWCPL